MPKGIRISYTPEMEAFLHEHRYMLREEMTALFNQTFGTDISRRVLSRKCERIGALTGRTGRLEKGHKPWNTGTKGLMKANATSFKKGQTTWNKKPVGYERVTRDGYVEVKVAEPNKFELKHRHIWQQAYGPIPKGQVLIFKNTNTQDCRLENLELISRGELVRLNQSYKHLVTPATNETCIAMAKVKHRIHQFEKGKN